jgi:hypothetical protein
MLRNTPKHHFASNGVDCILHNFGTPKKCIVPEHTRFSYFYVAKVSEML